MVTLLHLKWELFNDRQGAEHMGDQNITVLLIKLVLE